MDKNELYRFYKGLDRSKFIGSEYRNLADVDGPLPIGYGQTISQPSLVFEMTLQLNPDENSRVLEIGTGSGYQTALLARFSKEVYTIERIPELLEDAKERLEKLGYNNIQFKIGDGSEGWIEHAPFDRIIVTAAAGKIPGELVNELAVNGRMIAPVGPRGCQDLYLITKDEKGKISCESLLKVVFVEMKGKYGWTD